ncbi:hypothetical protein PRZ48_010041 [Zasmidium cellare]|uniref:Uncharacterized protein n=1 Tax=Zasmidium cellare TaxID=395010 RepID=A0ABR0EE10_ZASCE|nr:hypothetical protein PRZ48_010041 [Zasmidium cellare]
MLGNRPNQGSVHPPLYLNIVSRQYLARLSKKSQLTEQTTWGELAPLMSRTSYAEHVARLENNIISGYADPQGHGSLRRKRKRGVFWDAAEAEGKSMRENYLADGKGPRLRPDLPGSKFKWSSGDAPESSRGPNGVAKEIPKSPPKPSGNINKPQFLNYRNLDDVLGSPDSLARAAEVIERQRQR